MLEKFRLLKKLVIEGLLVLLMGKKMLNQCHLVYWNHIFLIGLIKL